MTTPPKILFLCHRVPYPPDKGDRIRSFRVLQSLARMGRVHLGFLADEPVPHHSLRWLRQTCEQVYVGSLGGKSRWLNAACAFAMGNSLTEGLFWSRDLSHAVRGCLQTGVDATVCFSSSMLPYVRGEPGERLIVDLVDVDSKKWLDYAATSRWPLSWCFRAESHRVRKLEREAARARTVMLISHSEAELYREIRPDARCQVITNGVDLDFYSPDAPSAANDSAEDPTCLFVGTLDYRANIQGIEWFVTEIWPSLIEAVPNATLQIVGRNPTNGVRRLAQMPGVSVVGPVADVRPFLTRADTVVVPLRVARGLQNKILEAMAMSRPVVASPCAFQGLQAVPGRDLLVADRPQEWIAGVKMLWTDREKRDEISARARQYVERFHNWSSFVQQLSGSLSFCKA